MRTYQKAISPPKRKRRNGPKKLVKKVKRNGYEKMTAIEGVAERYKRGYSR